MSQNYTQSSGTVNSTWQITLNLIIGIALGCILYRTLICRTIIKGPDSRDIIDKIYEWNGDKYKLEPRICACPIR